jgi:hypothetical protein
MAEVKKLLEDSDFYAADATEKLRVLLDADHAAVQAELDKGAEKARQVLAEIERNKAK